MGERGGRRDAGAPFYAPPRRKTSAEIISEARAAIYGEMSAASSSCSGGAVGALRPLRTRRPYTPREPQRTLFAERGPKKKDNRPPSAFDLKYLSLTESCESSSGAVNALHLNDELINGLILTEPQSNVKKKTLRHQPKSVVERVGEGWAGFTKLPHLSGRSKPLHRRNTNASSIDELKSSLDLSQAISVTRPFGSGGDNAIECSSVQNDEAVSRRKHQLSKSQSVDTAFSRVGDIAVRHLAVQLPHASYDKFENMSMLELAESLSQRSRDSEQVLSLLEALQSALESNLPGNNLRELVLRALYTHIDSDDERVLVAIARALLTLRVVGAHLAAACKIVFKIARNDKNDHFFLNTNLLELIVDGCGRTDPLSEGECCVYGAGALRFLALEPRLRALAHEAGALHLAALHLKILNNAKAENPRSVSEQSTHALYQVTGALRNLAGETSAAPSFVSSGALPELVSALRHHTDRDVLTNVARCLSVLSAEEACCEWLCANSESVNALIQALAACAARAPLAVRLAYTLGTMAAADERARINIYDEEGGLDVLLTIVESYIRRNDLPDSEADPDFHLIGSDLVGSDGSNEDVLIKTVRVIANLCLTERVGRGIANRYAERTVRALLDALLLVEISAAEAQSSSEQINITERREELATAALATLNNITFYREPPSENDPLDELLDQLCAVACRRLKVLDASSCEAVRALGNLTRSARAAQFIVIEGALDSLEPFLHHEDVVVRCAAAGVLVNVCGSGAGGQCAARAAADALCAAARSLDPHPAALLARALWNSLAHHHFNINDASDVAYALNGLIDDESVFATCEATKICERRASDPEISKHHVKFELANNNNMNEEVKECDRKFMKAFSIEHSLNSPQTFEGEDLGFEDGADGCECAPCLRLVAWEELVAVAIPLLEKLQPSRADASVGTDH